MFARFRQSGGRLQVSVIETRRNDGKVRHEHIASLGSIALPQSAAGRIAFWFRLHERLAKLSNRIDPGTQHNLMAAVHARVPMPTADDQRQVQLENARADAEFWSSIRDLQAGTAEGTKALAASAQARLAQNEAAAANANEQAKSAQERVERIERGENVEGGLGSSINVKAVLRGMGWTTADIRRAELFTNLTESEFDEMLVRTNPTKIINRQAVRVAHQLIRRRPPLE